MKFVFVSDIHGSMGYAKLIPEILDREDADKLVVLGDLFYHGPRNPLPLEYNPMMVSKMLNGMKEKLVVIKGNCDAEVDEMISEFEFNKSVILNIAGKRIFCSHGHQFNKDNFPNEGFDVMVYGHFHVGKIEKINEKICVNVGSMSLPKEGSANSYLVIDEQKITLKDLQGNVIVEEVLT